VRIGVEEAVGGTSQGKEKEQPVANVTYRGHSVEHNLCWVWLREARSYNACR
jgi:hypothetical protein